MLAGGEKDEKKKKKAPKQIPFGRGVRALFDYLKELDGEKGDLRNKLEFFVNRELQNTVAEIVEAS